MLAAGAAPDPKAIGDLRSSASTSSICSESYIPGIACCVRCAVAYSVALCFLLACATKPLHERDWVEVQTPHFEIVSSLDADATRELARDAEFFHTATEWAMGTPLRAPAVPTRIYAFDGRGFRRPFAVRGAPSSFLPSLRESVIVLRTGDGWQADTTPGLLHEYVHYLMRNHGGFDQPLWFDEGSAEFLSTVRVSGDHGELGGFRQDHVRLLRDQPWVPLIRILGVRDLEGWESRKRAIFYAESWAFVHYLNFGLEMPGQGQAQLNRYFRRVASGTSHERAVREAFGVGPSSLDRRLQRPLRAIGRPRGSRAAATRAGRGGHPARLALDLAGQSEAGAALLRDGHRRQPP